MGFQVFHPPYGMDVDTGHALRVFIGGSIEMGRAEDWQTPLIDFLRRLPQARNMVLFNPRRPDWDPSWPNDYNFAPFRGQVDWELTMQKRADVIVYYFAGHTISPITLLELGLFRDKKPIIGMDPAYLRAGNLLVTRDHFPDLVLHETWDAFTGAVAARIAAIRPVPPHVPVLSG